MVVLATVISSIVGILIRELLKLRRVAGGVVEVRGLTPGPLTSVTLSKISGKWWEDNGLHQSEELIWPCGSLRHLMTHCRGLQPFLFKETLLLSRPGTK